MAKSKTTSRTTTAKRRTAVWLSYDLGLQGEYPELYAWLDAQQAVECGDSVAFMRFEHTDNLVTSLEAALKEAITITSKTRFYVIYKDSETQNVKGQFLFRGRRHASPWQGHAVSARPAEVDGE